MRGPPPSGSPKRPHPSELPSQATRSSEPPADGTLPKTEGNVLLLTFDSDVSLPAGGAPALSIVPLAGGPDQGGAFAYSVEPDAVTLKAVEQGPALANQTWYRVTPAPDFAVAGFAIDLCTLHGDADGSDRGRVGLERAALVELIVAHYIEQDWPLERQQIGRRKVYYGCRPVRGLLTWDKHCLEVTVEEGTDDRPGYPTVPGTVNLYIE